MRLTATCLALLAASAGGAIAAPGDRPVGSPLLVFERTDLAMAGVGQIGAAGANGGGVGELQLEGVGGGVTQALLYWHGVDIEDAADGFSGGNGDYDEAEIVFAGQAIVGTRVAGGGYDNNWGDFDAPDPRAFSAALYRADVTPLVSGSGTYTISGLADGAGHSANGASLIVFHDDGDALNDVRVEHYEAMDSNLDSLVTRQWGTLLPVDYAGGQVELILHVADGQSAQADGEYVAHVYPGLLPGESTRFGFRSPHHDGKPLWGGTSVPQMGFGRPVSTPGLWDIRRFPITAGFHAPGAHAVYGYYAGGNDYLSLLVLQLVQSAPGEPAGITPTEHAFGDHPVGIASAVQQFTLVNLQNDDIVVGAVTRGFSAVFGLVANTCTGSVLAPGESCVVDVQCTPGDDRDYASSLQVAWEDSFGEDFSSRARMRCSGIAEGNRGRLAVDPPQAWLGTVAPGSTNATQRFTVSSIGDAPVTVGAIDRSGPYVSSFAIESNGCTGVVLAPGASCQFDLRFRPAPDRGLGTLFGELFVNFTTGGTYHIGTPILVAGTVVPDDSAIFKDGFESP